MDPIHNVPSIEEISFKLTQNVIPSQLYLNYNHPHDDSLDYTLSKVSIQQLLLDDEQHQRQSDHFEPFNLQKQCSLKSTCAGTTEPSSIRKTVGASFRHRVLSTRNTTQTKQINRRLSQNTMTLRSDNKQKKSEYIHPLVSPRPTPFRVKENKMRSLSGRSITSRAKLQLDELFEMNGSLSVKPIGLEFDTARQKIYMRKIIQNRMNAFPGIEDKSQYKPCRPQRKGYRIR